MIPAFISAAGHVALRLGAVFGAAASVFGIRAPEKAKESTIEPDVAKE